MNNDGSENMATVPKKPVNQFENDARNYAWNHFSYHAQQRQTVFNFYLLLVGGCVAAYASILGESGIGYDKFRTFMGVVLAFASLLFWRLDQRNSRLVKISEKALKELETRLAAQIHDQCIRLMHFADMKSSKDFPMCAIETFGQVYRVIFFCGGVVGISLAIRALIHLYR